jgi:ABC-type nitrate/sulfonate/bicarbonate transport system, ATPase component
MKDITPVVEASKVDLIFQTADGPVHAISDIDLDINKGDFISLIGPSGCGKTTLLRLIADLEKPTGGMLRVNGISPEEARLNRDYGYVFQSPALYPWRTVAGNLKLPLEIMGVDKNDQEIRAREALEMVDLAGFEKKFPWQLSGGMQQRVSIARALTFYPDLLLMDEPFGALDEIVRDQLNEHFHRLWEQSQKTVVFVTHSIPEAAYLSTKIVVMSPRPGKIIDVIESTLPEKRKLDIRETKEFLELSQRIRKGLRAGHSYD